MSSSEPCVERDWAARRIGWLLWRIPTAVVLLGAVLDAPWQAVLWASSFGVMGAACVLNAARCGRLHCFITGPLFLGAALASALQGFGVLPLVWTWLGSAVLVGVVLAHVPEWVRGRYVTAASSP